MMNALLQPGRPFIKILRVSTTDKHSRCSYVDQPRAAEDIRSDGAPFRLIDQMPRSCFEEIFRVHQTHSKPFSSL